MESGRTALGLTVQYPLHILTCNLSCVERTCFCWCVYMSPERSLMIQNIGRMFLHGLGLCCYDEKVDSAGKMLCRACGYLFLARFGSLSIRRSASTIRRCGGEHEFAWTKEIHILKRKRPPFDPLPFARNRYNSHSS